MNFFSIKIPDPKFILYLFLIIFLFFRGYSQDIHFSQYLNTPLLLNPATAGITDGDFRASLSHKSQWLGVTKYNTSTASYDMPMFKTGAKDAYLGAGLNVFADRAGTARLGTTNASVSAAGILPMGEFQSLSLGLQTAIVQRSASLNKLSWGNQFNGEGFDPNIASGEPNSASFVYADIAAGINYEFNRNTRVMLGEDMTKFSAGAAIFHPHSPRQRFLGSGKKIYPRMAFHASAFKDFNEANIAIVPSFIYLMQGPHTEMNMGMRLRYRLHEGTRWSGVFTETAVSLAFQYRLKDAIIPAVYFETGNYLISFTYDYPVAKAVKTGMLSTFEISIIYQKLDSGLRKSK